MRINFSLPGYELVHKALQRVAESIASVRHDVRRTILKQTTPLERALYGLNEYQILGPLQKIEKNQNGKIPFSQLSDEERRLTIVTLQKHRWSREQLEKILADLPPPIE